MNYLDYEFYLLKIYETLVAAFYNASNIVDFPLLFSPIIKLKFSSKSISVFVKHLKFTILSFEIYIDKFG